ncbi:hypothetical protein CEXT_468111 [Caerostris extrusa]|uniref:Transposase n=1 Tax=Caerostris extrusa TaxID=172846 RepID=A0AAV4SVI7_CAEEX|nr:hypothetical protein CEXT_468111 [Caerostris extrusa]
MTLVCKQLITDCVINILSEANEEWPMIIFPFKTHYSPTLGDNAPDTLDHHIANSTTHNRDINHQRVLMKGCQRRCGERAYMEFHFKNSW